MIKLRIKNLQQNSLSINSYDITTRAAEQLNRIQNKSLFTYDM